MAADTSTARKRERKKRNDVSCSWTTAFRLARDSIWDTSIFLFAAICSSFRVALEHWLLNCDSEFMIDLAPPTCCPGAWPCFFSLNPASEENPLNKSLARIVITVSHYRRINIREGILMISRCEANAMLFLLKFRNVRSQLAAWRTLRFQNGRLLV